MWWKCENNGYPFFDSEIDSESQVQGPTLSHFSQIQLRILNGNQFSRTKPSYHHPTPISMTWMATFWALDCFQLQDNVEAKQELSQ